VCRAPRGFLPLWEAPDPWLQQLVTNTSLAPGDLSSLMATSHAMCDAVMRCLDQHWRLRLEVREAEECTGTVTLPLRSNINRITTTAVLFVYGMLAAEGGLHAC
jgi:hypothetical protein